MFILFNNQRYKRLNTPKKAVSAMHLGVILFATRARDISRVTSLS